MNRVICRRCRRIVSIPEHIKNAKCIVCRQELEKIESSSIIRITESKELTSLTSSKMDQMIKKELKDLMETDEEVFNWIKKFITPAWLEEENKRIENFLNLSNMIEGFKDDPFIRETFIQAKFGKKVGESPFIVTKKPPEDQEKVQLSIQRIIPKYAEKARQMLDITENDWRALNLNKVKNPNTFLDIITKKFDSYWDYLLYLRTAYTDIFSTLKKFDGFPTIKFILTTIYEDIYQIDLQSWYRGEIFGYKNAIKLLADEL
jgi:hypothetical protein